MNQQNVPRARKRKRRPTEHTKTMDDNVCKQIAKPVESARKIKENACKSVHNKIAVEGQQNHPETDETKQKFHTMITGEYRDAFLKELDDAMAQRREPVLAEGLARARSAVWQAQEGEVRALYPDFDLARELSNPHFVALLTNRQYPFTVRQAYEAVHLDEIRQDIERKAAMRTFEALQRQAARPRESGAAPQAGLPTHLGATTRKERAALARRAAAGERIVL